MEKKDIVALVAGASTVGLIKGADELYYTLHPELASKLPFFKKEI